MWTGFDELSKAPVLSFRGELSSMLLAEVQDRMKERAAASFTVVTVPHVGHAPTLGEPVAIAAIATFLAQFDGKAGLAT